MLTFRVPGDTGSHLWDHPEAPETTLGTTLAHLRNQAPKKLQKTTFLGPLWGPKFHDNSCFFPIIFTCAPSEENKVKMSENVQKNCAQSIFDMH